MESQPKSAAKSATWRVVDDRSSPLTYIRTRLRPNRARLLPSSIFPVPLLTDDVSPYPMGPVSMDRLCRWFGADVSIVLVTVGLLAGSLGVWLLFRCGLASRYWGVETLGIMTMGGTVKNREDMATLMGRVSVDPVTGCWLWCGTIVAGGCGQIEVAGRVWLAHIFSWALHHRPDWDEAALVAPLRLVVQRCEVASCVNPYHLCLGGAVDPVRACRAVRGRRVRGVSDDQVREIRGGAFNDATYARRFGVAATTVRDIRNRVTKILVPDRAGG